MSKELEVKKAVIDSKTIENFLFTSGTKLNEKQEALFLQLALRNQLDPFKREIHAITYKNKTTGELDLSIVTGYQVYIQRAETTGQLNGWHCEAMRNEKNELIGAKIVIYRKDFQYPFEWEVSLKEFTKEQANWRQMPEFMIKKVCIGQGFRLAFPNELGGLPYLQEELEELTPVEEKGTLVAHINDSKIVTDSESKQGPLPKQVIKESNDPAIESQIIAIRKLLRSLNWSEEEYKKTIGHPHFHELTKGQASNLIEDLQGMKKKEVKE